MMAMWDLLNPTCEETAAMPEIQDLLDGDLIIEDIQATDKTGVIREFAALLRRTGRIEDEEHLVSVILERESTTTGIGDGLAIPHGKLKEIREVIVAFGRSRKGVDFQSMDNKPVYLFFLFVTPESKPDIHLTTLRRLARVTRNPVLRERLMHSTDRLEMQKLILDEDGRYADTR
jgi:PTS system nitrogen regulatory IIA component